MKWTKILIIIILFFPIFTLLAVSQSDTVEVNLRSETELAPFPICNQNGICEISLGENENNCWTDCGCNNNGVCEEFRGENERNCSNDCPPGTIPVTFLEDFMPPQIYNILISKITLNSAIIFWLTNEPSFCKLFWGKTEDYEEEIISEDNFYLDHSTKLINLSPETDYHFKIYCKDKNQNEAETNDYKFTTLTPPDITPPSNVSDFQAIPGDKKIILKWKNPPEADFKEVKIVRSTKFYPANPWDGLIIYTGRGEYFEDTGLTNGVTYYYTAFSYDKKGNYSSGSIVSSVPQAPPVPPEKPPIKPPVRPPVKPPVLPPAVPPPPSVEKIELKDFDFYQAGKKLPLIEGKKVIIKEGEPLTISIDYEKVPEVLKTIMVTLRKESKYFSFLLRVDKTKTKYSAKLLPPEPGVYPIEIYVLDFKNQTLKLISGILEVKGVEGAKRYRVLEKEEVYCLIFGIFLALLLLFIIGYILFTKKRRKKSAQSDKNYTKNSF